MSTAKITLIGLETYLSGKNESIFDNLDLPSGIDKDTLIASIFMRSGEFEVLYPDPNFMKMMVGYWGKKYYPTFERWILALTTEYNPLDNYDRHEEWEDNHAGTFKSKTESENNSEGSNKSKIEQDDTTTTTGDKSAYNVSTYSHNNKDETVLDGDQNSEGSYEDSAKGKSSQDNQDAWTNKHKAHIRGNIGVTTSAQMLQGELDVRKEYNIYNMISDLFVSEFCLLIY